MENGNALPDQLVSLLAMKPTCSDSRFGVGENNGYTGTRSVDETTSAQASLGVRHQHTGSQPQQPEREESQCVGC